jgi:hypothetical protein
LQFFCADFNKKYIFSIYKMPPKKSPSKKSPKRSSPQHRAKEILNVYPGRKTAVKSLEATPKLRKPGRGTSKKTPLMRPSSCQPGSVMTGQDGRDYFVQIDSFGYKRWSLCSSGKKNGVDCKKAKRCKWEKK